AGPIALVAIQNPPVNAASHAVREGLWNAVETLDTDPDVKVIAIYGSGKTFIAGADIREFGKPPQEPMLGNVCSKLETLGKPIIAVCHGNALGGGLETALGCHARIAIDGLTVGFPEVTLGILPGAGGTQRAPRLTGIKAALDLITTGKRVNAQTALELGLVDRVTTGDPREVALAAAQEVLSGTLKTRSVRDIDVEPDDAAIDAAAKALAAKQPLVFSPHKCVEAVAASTLPIEDGLAREREFFGQCMESPQRAGLIHAFFSERAVTKIPEAGASPRKLEKIGIIGGGTMGSGIATAALLAGFTVRLNERNDDALSRGVATIEKNLDGAVKRGKLTDDERRAILDANLHPSTELSAFADVDLVIEAVFEDLDVKRTIFKALDGIVKNGAILASNTSHLDINALAAETSRPADVMGLHFFSPAHIMRLLEVVVADKTAPEVVATGFALGKKLGKVAVRAGVCDGFIGNRILSHYRKVADYLVLEGATPQEVDAALEAFGFAMGPFAVSDLAGLDIGWATRKRQAAFRSNQERYVSVGDRICEGGNYGRKTGKGYYVYGGEKLVPNPDVEGFIAAERAEKGITPKTFTADDIVERYMTAMIAEATRVLDDGIALRPIDIDAVFLFGYGFPRFRGGPLHYADTLGAAELKRRIEAYAAEDSYFWQVPSLIAQMAQDGTTFASRN
ncbi:MAG: 3-hydroxyacyl-CoA dehydrogenase NAD-binding domain-containing protein, partial [Pseudomonadota bacterium]